MRKLFAAISITTLVFLSISSRAQTTDEIISKHLEARGGIDKLRLLQTMIIEGSMNQGGTDVEMKFYYMNNKANKVEFTAAGQSGYNIVTATEGWSFNPFAGNSAAEPMEEIPLKEAQLQLDLQGPLVDYKTKGHMVEYLGKESIQGEEFHKIKLTRANKKVTTYYLTKDFLIAKAVSTAMTPQGEEREVTSEYADYRKTPEGYVIPFKRTNNGLDFIFSKVEINPKIDDSVFKPSN